MSDSYRIANWAQYQHYKKRSPPWVKLYFDLLSSETWITGDDKTRCLMIACILAASRNDGNVPANPAYIQKIAHLNSAPDFNPLVLNGFLAASNALAECVQDASNVLDTLSLSLSLNTPEEKREKKNTRDRDASAALADGFSEFYAAYPRKTARAAAEKAWKKLAPDNELRLVIMSALKWQAALPDWTKDGGQYAPYPATYLNNRRWEDERPGGGGAAPPRQPDLRPNRNLRVWEIPIPDDRRWECEGRLEMGQVYRDGLWVKFADLDPEDPEYRAGGAGA